MVVGPYVEDRFHFGGDDFGDNFLYHYTSAESFEKIVASRSLRLGRLTNCNDPRERKEFLLNRWSIQGDPPEEVSEESWKKFESNVRRLLQSNKYVACFTRDRPMAGDEGYFYRGFGRARNWEQYGDHHRGVVLSFDRRRLLDTLFNWRYDHTSCPSDFHAARVSYKDAPIMVGDEHSFGINFSAASVALGPELRAHRLWNDKRSLQSLFFEKATDWSSEDEYRVLVRCECETEPMIPIGDALVAVVLGEDCADLKPEDVRAALQDAQLLPLSAAKMRWTSGAPYAESFPEQKYVTPPMAQEAWLK